MTEILSRPGPPPDRTVPYGDHPDQVYDLRSPRPEFGGATTGTIVVVHGGFWRPETDRAHAGAHAQALADEGHHVAVLEYRRTPGDWEAMAADVLAGVAAVRAQAPDPDHVVLVGHSAGGHLVAWAAHQPETAGIRGVVSLAGCVDLALVDELGLGDGAAQALMGTARADDRERWERADPTVLGPAPCPVRLVHGTDDDTVPLRISTAYGQRTGAPLTEVADAGHMDLVDPTLDAWRPGARATTGLLGG